MWLIYPKLKRTKFIFSKYFYEKNQVAEVKKKIQHRAEPHMWLHLICYSYDQWIIFKNLLFKYMWHMAYRQRLRGGMQV